MPFFQDIKNVFTRTGSGLMRIILINVIVFLGVNITDEVIRFAGGNFSFLHLFALPGDISAAVLRAWSLVSYMFLHKDLFHILFNMLWLYWLGKIFVEFAGSKQLVGVYLLGGLCGGILYLLFAVFAPQFFAHTVLLGASAGVMAVVIAVGVLLPEYVIYLLFFGGVKLKYVALVSFILTSLLDLSQNTGGKISHIGGAVFGLLFTLQYKKGNDLTLPLMNFLETAVKFFFGRKPRVKVTYRRKTSDEEFNAKMHQRQQKIDNILDKISKSGYESLTREEKDFLFNESSRG